MNLAFVNAHEISLLNWQVLDQLSEQKDFVLNVAYLQSCWVGQQKWVSRDVGIRIDPTPQPNRIALNVPSDFWTVIPIVVVMSPIYSL